MKPNTETALIELVKTLAHEALMRIESDLANPHASKRDWLIAQKDTITALMEQMR